MEEFNATEWFTVAGISEGGQKKLLTAEIKDEASIEYLDEVTLQLVKLAPGDFVKFRKSRDLFAKSKELMPELEEDTSIGQPTGEVIKKTDSDSRVLITTEYNPHTI